MPHRMQRNILTRDNLLGMTSSSPRLAGYALTVPSIHENENRRGNRQFQSGAGGGDPEGGVLE